MINGEMTPAGTGLMEMATKNWNCIPNLLVLALTKQKKTHLVEVRRPAQGQSTKAKEAEVFDRDDHLVRSLEHHQLSSSDRAQRSC
ncbi:hypothetical protein OPV22_033002 [Ensete ventricosum]|uniref:Uncharacterized protein n=1 Tax=Ensete ventricosum TaxID=4639 RepID=A0AAV8P0K1_ENSVE|nr:hypothetical protein OPV22_033002 [Ensete ventricosum]